MESAAPHAAVRETLRTSVFTTPLVLLGRSCTLAIYLLLAYRFGIDGSTAPLFYAWNLASTFAFILGTSVEQAFVPLYHAAQSSGGFRRIVPQIRIVALWSAAGLGVTALALPSGLRAFSVFEPDSADRVQILFVAFVPGLLIHILTSALRGVLSALRRFELVASATVLEGLLQAGVTFALLDGIGLVAVPVALTAASVGGAFLLWWAGLRRVAVTSVGTGTTLSERPFLLAQVLGTAMVSLNPVIDQMFAARLGAAEVTALSYATRFALIPTGLLVSGFLPVFLSTVSAHFREGAYQQGRRYAYHCLSLAAVASIVLGLFCAGVLSQATWIAELFNVELSPNATTIIRACMLLVAGTTPSIVMMMLGKVHIALMNYRAIWAGSAVSVCCNVLFDALLYRRLGVPGIALATVLNAAAVTLVLLSFFVRRPWEAGREATS